MKKVIAALSLCCLFFPTILPAQDTFTDSSQFQAAICGDIFGGPIDLDTFTGQTQVGEGISIFDSTQILELGTISADEPFIVGFVDQVAGDCIVVDEDSTLVLTPNASLGNVEGFCFEYTGAGQIVVFDGTTVIDTITPPPVDPSLGMPASTICWLNSSQSNVTRIELVDSDPGLISISICGIQIAFGDGCDTDPTSQDRLQNIIDNLIVKLDSASGYDVDWIHAAIYELQCAQDPYLWETEDRLSDYGCEFFEKNFYATYYLECVSDNDLVEDCLIGIQDLLGSIVDAEIDFALENPYVNNNLLAYAEYFEDFADAFADAELYLNAVILHFYAWLFASNA